MFEVWTKLGAPTGQWSHIHIKMVLERITQANIKLLQWPSHSLTSTPLKICGLGVKARFMPGSQPVSMNSTYSAKKRGQICSQIHARNVLTERVWSRCNLLLEISIQIQSYAPNSWCFKSIKTFAVQSFYPWKKNIPKKRKLLKKTLKGQNYQEVHVHNESNHN